MEEHIRLQERIRQAQEERRRAQEQEARRAREEEARRAQEEQARRAQEEERRQQEYRRQQEEYARNTASPQQPQVSGDEISARYDHLWTQIKSLDNDSLDGHSVPWPLRFRFSCMEDINAANVEAFVMYPHRASMEGKNRRQRLRAELLHWHPDKFQSLVLPKILPYQREKVTEVASAVVQVLTELMETA
ncbi:hypothetical protein OF83DRAFT_1099751 [Amylostereum chailletii]|nr:hypothetical protein OF83DRAFT_1099751 [Amylostereum chailletii]